jgi:hypothetical protein
LQRCSKIIAFLLLDDNSDSNSGSDEKGSSSESDKNSSSEESEDEEDDENVKFKFKPSDQISVKKSKKILTSLHDSSVFIIH